METSSPPTGAYAVVERLHLRQWALRIVAPLAAAATNGAGRLDVAWLPRHDLIAASPATENALRGLGAAFVVLAAVLRVLAKGVLVRKTTLTTGGVYAVLRHPFYAANLVGAAGVFLLAGPLGAVVGAAWLAAAAPIYAVTIRAEDKALARLYPKEFAAYAGRVRALLPGAPAGGVAARATWAGLRAEREPPRLLRFLAGALLVASLTLTGRAADVLLAAAALLFGGSFGLR